MGLFSYISGNIGDRFGHKYSLVMAYALHLSAILLVLFSRNMFWVYSVFIAVGAGQGSFMPSAMNLIYDFAGERDKKTYMAIIDSFLAPFSLIFILGIGSFVNDAKYILSLFVMGCCLFIAIIILYYFVEDPKHNKDQIIMSENWFSSWF